MKNIKWNSKSVGWILLILLISILRQSVAQEAFIGGIENMPVIDAESYEYQETIYNFSSQLRWVQASSDGDYIYTGTVFYEPELKLYKIDAATHEIIATSPVPYTVQDLEITNDDQYLFHHNSATIYKVSTDDLSTVDSFNLGKNISYIEIMDEHSVFASSTERIYKIDFVSHSIADSIVFDTWDSPAELILNQNKTKLFTLQSSMPNTMFKIDLNSSTIENEAALTGSIGLASDLILSADGFSVFVASNGNQNMDGSVLQLDTENLNVLDVTDKDPGSGVMSFAPNGLLWIPNNTSNSISVFDPVNTEVVHSIQTSDYMNGPFMVAFAQTTGVGFQDMKLQTLKIYPNPAHSNINIEIKEAGYIAAYEIRDLSSCLIMKGKIQGKYARLNIDPLDPGIYFLNIKGEDYTISRSFIRK